ncbi:MAG: membrane protein insertase YidC [Rhodocyclales bacterium GWA2_65_20]|nr:MAG: membrane protein insertase YidC [Rhodocyclales bacterium GWA2_65_20]
MDNRRLILLLVFSFSLLMLWEAWQKQGQPQPAPAATAPAAVGNAAVPAPSAVTAAPGAVPTATLPSAVPAAAPAGQQAARATIKTDLYQADISALGGDLIRLELLNHHATEDKTKKFVLFDESHLYAAQSGLIGAGLPNHKTVWQLPAGSQGLKDGANELRLRMTAAGEGGVQVAKTYVFHRGSYLIDVEFEVANGGSASLTPSAYFQLVRDDKAPEGGTMMVSTFTGPAIYSDAEKFQKIEFADIAKGKDKHVGKADDGWVAMVQHYFVSAWLPQGVGEREFFTRKLGGDFFAAGVIVPMAAVAPGATGKLGVPLYAGPQEQDKLKQVAPGLDLVVDYGWLTVIAAPLFWVLELIHKFTGNWGWAIIGLTVMLKLIFFPLSAASYKSMAKMRLLTPKLTKLKETYGDDRQRMNTEMMELYKKEKVNPLGGCLPVLVQIPVFIALYWVLLGSVEMRQATWLGWITDLSAKDPYYILPLIMGVTMLIQTKLNPTPPDPIQAKVMMIMPIVFTGMFLMFPSGLVLYWTVNNVLSIAQQWQINRMMEASGLKK